MHTLKHILLGDVIDVIHSARSNRIYLVLDPDLGWGSPHYLVPLLCPVCGQPWHFVWNDTPENLTAALKKSMSGFQLVQVRYVHRSSARDIATTMEKFSLGSTPSELIIESVADHVGENGIFPVTALSFEKRVPSLYPTPFELRAMSPDEVRAELDLDEHQNIEKAIREIECWMASDDYEDFDVDDDIFLAVHPTAVLDAVVVDPEYASDETESFPYQAILKLVEDVEASEDESGGADNNELGGLEDEEF